MIKLKDYELMGVQTIVLLGPGTEAIYRFIDGSLERVTSPVQQIAGGRCSVDWQKVHELLD